MNILPLVITFLLIFSAISISFVASQATDKTEGLAYQGRIRALRQAYNEVEEHMYDQLKESGEGQRTSNQTSSNSSDQTPEEKPYFRLTRMGSKHGALNLVFLTEKNLDNEWLREKAIQYLEEVYQEASFVRELKNPHWASELLDFFVAAQKKALKETQHFLSFDKLVPEGPLKEFYPKLIRGTNSFDPIRGKGYLPLERCITFSKRHTKPINFHFANPKLLTVFLGVEATEKIMHAEWPDGHPRKEASNVKNYALQIKELKTLLGDQFDERLERVFDGKYHVKGKFSKQSVDLKTFISAQVVEESSPE
jgi:hypothetical protein